MCFFRRIVYDSCSHSQTLGPDPVRKCYLQLAYECGQIDVPCGKLWQHSYASIKVGGSCKDCNAKMSKTSATLTKIKRQLAQAKLTLKIVDTKDKDAETGEGQGDDEVLSPFSVGFTLAVAGNKTNVSATS